MRVLTPQPNASWRESYIIKTVKNLLSPLLSILIRLIIEVKNFSSSQSSMREDIWKLKKKIKNILVIELFDIGDVILTFPVIEAIGKEYPLANIDYLVQESTKEIVIKNPYINRVISFPMATLPIKNLPLLYKVLRDIRAQRYELALVMEYGIRNTFFALLSGANYIIGYLYSKLWDRNYLKCSDVVSIGVRFPNKISYDSKKEHIFKRCCKVVTYLVESDIGKGIIYWDKEDEEYVQSLLEQNEKTKNSSKRVGIHLGGRLYLKRWPAYKFRAISEKMAKEGYIVYILGSSNDSLIIHEVIQGQKGIIDLTGKLSLVQLGCLIDKLDLFIGNDSGALHIASAVGTPVVGLFGPTHPDICGPYWGRSKVIYKKMDCSPCDQLRCHKDKESWCMNKIAVDEVIEACKILLMK